MTIMILKIAGVKRQQYEHILIIFNLQYRNCQNNKNKQIVKHKQNKQIKLNDTIRMFQQTLKQSNGFQFIQSEDQKGVDENAQQVQEQQIQEEYEWDMEEGQIEGHRHETDILEQKSNKQLCNKNMDKQNQNQPHQINNLLQNSSKQDNFDRYLDSDKIIQQQDTQNNKQRDIVSRVNSISHNSNRNQEQIQHESNNNSKQIAQSIQQTYNNKYKQNSPQVWQQQLHSNSIVNNSNTDQQNLFNNIVVNSIQTHKLEQSSQTQKFIQQQHQPEQNIQQPITQQQQISRVGLDGQFYQNISQDKLQQQIRQMELERKQMEQMIKNKQFLQKQKKEQQFGMEFKLSQNILQMQENKCIDPDAKQQKSGSKTQQQPNPQTLHNLYKSNQKIQKIYQSQLHSLNKLEKQLSQKLQTYMSKSLLKKSIKNSSSTTSDIQMENSSASSTNQPLLANEKQLYEYLHEQILGEKQKLLFLEKSNFLMQKDIKNHENVLARQDGLNNTSGHASDNKKKKQGRSMIELAESINMKKKLQEKLKQKLQKLQFQYNATYLKSEEINDTFRSLIEKHPQMAQEKSTNSNQTLETKNMTLQKWSNKSNQNIVNKNLHQMLKKRKQKAQKAKQLMKKQYEHEQRQLQRDMKGLKKLIIQKQNFISSLQEKNEQIQNKFNQTQKQIQSNKNKQSQTINKKNNQRQEINNQPQNKELKSIKINIQLYNKNQNNAQKLPIQIKEQQLSRKQKYQANSTIQKQQIKIQSTIQQTKQINRNKILNKSNHSKQKIQQQTKKQFSPIKQMLQVQNDKQSFSKQQNKLKQQNNNNFRITRPKFPKFKNKSNNQFKLSIQIERKQQTNDNQLHKESKSPTITSTSRLLKPTLLSSRNKSTVALENSNNFTKNNLLQKRSISFEKSNYNNFQQSKSNYYEPHASPKISYNYNNSLPYDQRPIINNIQNVSYYQQNPQNKKQIKQSKSSIKNNKKQQQMMNILRQSIFKVTSQSKKKKLLKNRQVQDQQKNLTDNQKTLRNLLNESLLMIRNQSINSINSQRQVAKSKKIESPILARNRSQSIDQIKTPKIGRRPYIHKNRLSTNIAPQNASLKIQKQHPSSNTNVIEQQMQKVKQQIQSTILQLKNIQRKLNTQSLYGRGFNNSTRKKNQSLLSIHQKKSYAKQQESVEVDSMKEDMSNQGSDQILEGDIVQKNHVNGTNKKSEHHQRDSKTFQNVNQDQQINYNQKLQKMGRKILQLQNQ